MSKKFWFFAIALFILPVAGCNGCYNQAKHWQSDIVGIKRRVKLYASDGTPIQEWTTTSKIEDNGGTIYFLVGGKAVTISGTFTVEE